MGVFDNIKEFFSLVDEDDDYDYDSNPYDDDEEEVSAAQLQRQEKVQARRQAKADREQQRTITREPRTERMSRSKVIPIRRTNGGFEVCIVRPSDKDNAEEACSLLMNNCAVVLNLEGLDMAKAQGIIDFISGCLYAIDGNMQSISKYIVVCTPNDIDISGESLEEITGSSGDSYSVTLDQEF